jgi:esterase/lipase superfamily enzyme
MAYSWMKFVAAACLITTVGCAEQPARSAAQFKRDADEKIIESDEADSSAASVVSEEPTFDSLTEPEPSPAGANEVVPDASDHVPAPPQLVIPTHPQVSPPKKKSPSPHRPSASPNSAKAESETISTPSSAPTPAPVVPSPDGGGGSQLEKTVRRSGITQDRHGYLPEIVYFATNREPDRGKAAGSDPDLYFGGDRGQLAYGTCEVSIPYKRKPGTLPEPSILRLEFSQDPAKHVVLMEIDLLPHAEFWKQLRAAVEASPEQQLMIFVHGYCATFRDAARRTAQMSYDLNYKGPAMFFSWPAGAESESFEERANYLKDLRRAEESDDDLITVLGDISRYSGAKSIHLVAHSMGNYVLTEALKTIDDRRPPGVRQIPLFDQVALAAPDINAREFVERTGERLLPFSRRFTVYASSQDKALRLSKVVNGFEPLGFLNDYTRVGAKKRLFDLVDVSQLTTSWFDSGHIYYGDMPEMISDFSYLFRGVQAASLQRGLAETPPIYRLARRVQ